MATTKAQLRNDLDSVQRDHADLMPKLAELDRLLKGIVCYPGVYANLAGIDQVKEVAKWLGQFLPAHCEREESTVLANMARGGQGQTAFALEMARQHARMCKEVELLSKLCAEIENCDNLEEVIPALTESGQELVAFVAAHMGAEERQLMAARPQ